MTIKFQVIKFTFLFILIQFSFSSYISIDKNSRHFVDIEGRVRVFHGVNIVVKNPPYVPIEDHFDPLYSLTDEDYDYLTKFGFNVVRLGVIWEAVETSPGVYDQVYLDTYERIINKLGERGIYTILDSHQDMFSRILCGEGVPIFYAKNLIYQSICGNNLVEKLFHLAGVCTTLKDRNIPVDGFGIPLLEECIKHSFMDLHLVIELASIYNSFFKNLDGIQDKFIEYWKVLAKKFKGNKYIIGYDIWNEPWVGNLFTELINFLPGQATNYTFLPFYQKVNDNLRKVDENYVLMFEEALFPDTLPFFGGLYLGGFKTTPAGQNNLNKQIWSKHLYCYGASADMAKHKIIPPELAKVSCIDYADYIVRKSYEKSIELGVPVFYTEFGACRDNESCYWEVKALADACDKYMLSWSYWAFKPYGDHTTVCNDDTEGMWNPDGSLQKIKTRALTRPYIMAFQGSPIKSYYYTDLNVFNARYVLNNDINESTVLYFHKEMFYENGYKFVFIAHEFSRNDSKNDLGQFEIKLSKNIRENFDKNNSSLVANEDINLENQEWDNLNNLNKKDYNYIKFKFTGNDNTCTAENSCKKSYTHEYLGFSEILENTVEVLLVPKVNYEVHIDKTIYFKNIEVNIENISLVDQILTPNTSDNIILLTDSTKNSDLENNLSIHYEYQIFDDLSLLDSSSYYIHHLHFDKETLINQIYIPRLIIQIYKENKIHAEITFSNLCNHLIKINLKD